MTSIQRLDDRYLLGRPIGEGSVGSVFEAWDSRSQGWCAVKVLHVNMSSSRTAQERFRREALALDRLEHRGIVRIWDWGEARGAPYLVMELVRGGSLLGWLHRHGAMPPALAVRCALEVCRALEAAHAQSITHRDVKPSNVLIGEGGVCKVADFGIARLGEESFRLTRTGMRMGSPGFMAPEQELNAKEADHRADLYGVGATLYSLVVARMPRSMAAALREDDEVLAGPVGRVIMRATLSRPEQRYGSASEMAAVLARLLEILPPVAEGTPPLYSEQLAPLPFPASHPTLVGDEG